MGDSKKLLLLVLIVVAAVAIASVVFMQKKHTDQVKKALPSEPPAWFGKTNTGVKPGEGINQAPSPVAPPAPMTAPR
jgi:flagellar basal body-associated protein FliL